MADESSIGERALVAAYEASLSVASDLDLDTVLKRIVDLARFLVRARYAAVSITGPEGVIEAFVTSGISEEERAAIGAPPVGKGLLGEITTHQMPLMVPDISRDPRSCGFPPNHPPMTSLLAVPVQVGHRLFGNLYLSDREDDQPFDSDDLQVVQVLAGHAATAVDRALLHHQMIQSRNIAEEQRDQLRVMLESLPSAVLIHGQDALNVELANSAALEMLLGDSASAGKLPVYGEDFVFVSDDGDELALKDRPSARAIRGETVKNRQLGLRRSDGFTTPVLVQAGPLRGHHRRSHQGDGHRAGHREVERSRTVEGRFRLARVARTAYTHDSHLRGRPSAPAADWRAFRV